MAKVWTKGTIALTVVLVFILGYDFGRYSQTLAELSGELVATILVPVILIGGLRVAYIKVRGRVGTLRSPTN